MEYCSFIGSIVSEKNRVEVGQVCLLWFFVRLLVYISTQSLSHDVYASDLTRFRALRIHLISWAINCWKLVCANEENTLARESVVNWYDKHDVTCVLVIHRNGSPWIAKRRSEAPLRMKLYVWGKKRILQFRFILNRTVPSRTIAPGITPHPAHFDTGSTRITQSVCALGLPRVYAGLRSSNRASVFHAMFSAALQHV